MTNSQSISFWKFLREHSIKIPIIQRDYAQGRKGKGELRKSFLENLKQALDGKLPNGEKVLKLDFIYGSEKERTIFPLDGQQRLTTLWLLHWYVAMRAGKLSDATDNLKKFSYETRISSREFCEQLCNSENFKNFNEGKITDFITKQTWFYSAWKQDPTIQSMLRMLSGSSNVDGPETDFKDGIEKIFKETDVFTTYWEKLIDENDCPIVFYHLPLKDFGLSDDLYIKMNARGKPLTSFENFKADLIGYIQQQSKDHEDEVVWMQMLDQKDGLPIKLDTSWTDIFWKNKSVDNEIDEIYFAFINRFFLNYGIKEIKDENDEIYKYFTNVDDLFVNNEKTYVSFDLYKLNGNIQLELFEQLQNVFDNYQKSKIDEKTNILRYDVFWNKNFYFIPQYNEEQNAQNRSIGKVYGINQKERVAFYAISKYLYMGPVETNDIGCDYTSLCQWMRFVWNLISVQTADGNDDIRSVAEMKNAINLIDEIDDPHNVYNSLCKLNQSDYTNSILKEQFSEEIIKAKQILDENGKIRRYNGNCKKEDGSTYSSWEEIIIAAEKYAFFKGGIRFLFQDKNGQVDIDSPTNAWNVDNFDKKWNNTQKYFDANGVRHEYQVDALLLCSFLSKIDIGEYWFGYDKMFWRNALLNKEWCWGIDSFLMQAEMLINANCSDWKKDVHLISAMCINEKKCHKLGGWRRYDALTNYYSRRISEKIQYHSVVVLNHSRDNLLKNDAITISPDCFVREGHSHYLYDWDVYFKYQSYFFKWEINASGDIIVLTTEGWKEKTSYSIEWSNERDFLEELNNLINQYNQSKNQF